MNYKKELQDSVARIASGVPINEQINQLLESKGWWPPPNTKWGRPLSDEFWTKLIMELLNRKIKGENPSSILRQLARNWEVSEDLIEEFLRVTGLLGAFRSCTLDSNAIVNIFTGATRGSGVWTAGTKLSIIGKHHFDNSVGTDKAPKKEKEPGGAEIPKSTMHHNMGQKWPRKLHYKRPRFWWRKKRGK